jgi:hypothetical protein
VHVRVLSPCFLNTGQAGGSGEPSGRAGGSPARKGRPEVKGDGATQRSQGIRPALQGKKIAALFVMFQDLFALPVCYCSNMYCLYYNSCLNKNLITKKKKKEDCCNPSPSPLPILKSVGPWGHH